MLHGTHSSYVTGCRCDACREAARVYKVELKERRRNDPNYRRPTDDERFAAKWVQEDCGWSTSCHAWTAAKNWDGYGSFKVGGRPVLAHRWAYTRYVGEIPDGLTLDHLCRVRTCVNVEHLEPVTSAVNGLRGESLFARNARKETCPKGHPYEALSGESRRICRTCSRDNAIRQRLTVNAAAEALGLTPGAYRKRYGWSRVRAEEVLRELGVTL